MDHQAALTQNPKVIEEENATSTDPVDLDLPLCECGNETVVPGSDSCRTCSGIGYTIYGMLEKTDGPEDKRGWWIFGVYEDGIAFRNGPYADEAEAKTAKETIFGNSKGAPI